MAKIFSLEVSKIAQELIAQMKQSDMLVKDCREKVEEIKTKYKNEQ